MPLYGGQETQVAGGAVLYEKLSSGVAVITLNKPDRMNGWSDVVGGGWYDAYDLAVADPDVKIIVVTGAGRAFCAGADMGGLESLNSGGGISAGPDPKKLEEMKAGVVNDGKGRPLDYAMHVPKPIVAAINGACAGGGLSQAMSCDIRFAAEGATFAAGFTRRGLIGEWGISWTMPRIAGVGNAMDILLSGRKFVAEEAKQLGLVQRVFPKDQLVKETIAYAEDIAKNVPANSLSIIKQQIISHQHSDAETALRQSNRLMLLSTTKANPDFEEGVSSYVQKRAPKFNALNPDSPMQKLKRELFPYSSKL